MGSCFSHENKMNILSQIVHGTREVPDLGQVARKVETPSVNFERATLGLG